MVVADRGLEHGTLEYKGRRDSDNTMIAADSLIDFLRERLQD